MDAELVEDIKETIVRNFQIVYNITVPNISMIDMPHSYTII